MNIYRIFLFLYYTEKHCVLKNLIKMSLKDSRFLLYHRIKGKRQK